MAEQQDLADLIKNIQADVSTLVKGEIELAKAELVPQARSAGVAGGLLGGAAYFAITGLTLVFFCLSCLLGLGFVTWFSLPVLGGLAWGFVIVAVVLFLVAGIFGLVARQKMVFTAPTSAIEHAEKTGNAVSNALTASYKRIRSLPLSGAKRQPELE